MITEQEYVKEIKSITYDLVEEAMEQNDNESEAAMEAIHDHLLHELVNSQQWVIYTAYNLPVLQHSKNADYMIDNIGDANEVLEERGLDGLHNALAYWAMYGDISETLEASLEEYEDQLNN